ncbi:MAG: RNA-binding S4 domain-containing protein [Firmicutes bacterium]|nr:RNA-binding S4 domain-containing protein [Bacillota bacterium]
MRTILITTDYIRLDQLMKWANLVDSGGEAKALVRAGEVRVNGRVETARGRKLRSGDRVEYGSEVVVVERSVEGCGDCVDQECPPDLFS